MLSSLDHGSTMSRRRCALVANLDMAPPTKETLEKEEDYTKSLVHILVHVLFVFLLSFDCPVVMIIRVIPHKNIKVVRALPTVAPSRRLGFTFITCIQGSKCSYDRKVGIKLVHVGHLYPRVSMTSPDAAGSVGCLVVQA